MIECWDIVQNVKKLETFRPRDLDLWLMTFILNLHNIVFELYLYSKFGAKILIGYKDMSQNVGRQKKTRAEKKTEKKNPSVKQYVSKWNFAT